MAMKISFPIPSSRWSCICNLNSKQELGIYLQGLCINVYAHYVESKHGRIVLGFNACLVMKNARDAFKLEQELKADGFDVYLQATK